jgi:hypothetical protein
MSTIPSRLARVATSSHGDVDVARKRALKLYRNWWRSVRVPKGFFLSLLVRQLMVRFAHFMHVWIVVCENCGLHAYLYYD